MVRLLVFRVISMIDQIVDLPSIIFREWGAIYTYFRLTTNYVIKIDSIFSGVPTIYNKMRKNE